MTCFLIYMCCAQKVIFFKLKSHLQEDNNSHKQNKHFWSDSPPVPPKTRLYNTQTLSYLRLSINTFKPFSPRLGPDINQFHGYEIKTWTQSQTQSKNYNQEISVLVSNLRLGNLGSQNLVTLFHTSSIHTSSQLSSLRPNLKGRDLKGHNVKGINVEV